MKRISTPILAAFMAIAIGTSTAAVSAQTPAPAPAIDPVGTFEFSTTVQGQTVNGSMTLTKTEGVLGGKIMADIMPEIPLKSAVLEGKKLTLTAETPDGVLTLVLDFEDADKFAGNWTLAGDGGAITGKRKV